MSTDRARGTDQPRSAGCRQDCRAVRELHLPRAGILPDARHHRALAGMIAARQVLVIL
ncbi:hypothetical protein R2601_04298 [Salipiger bermudensis HTCC2601]|uniref:Uncharacterized protein n=1 Tax=Salipiger bermudensis (strain DSM 26914 / JCM 13377 / KCTC 12554 / HTCC2601) TaxID=314265 RepID=Q0FVY6_SALBH|nr:hypothetical protein R2601_04298 [Salipiger bermudensis HTCC2601]